MKTRLKELFFGGIGGIFIGLFFSMIVSYFYNPAYLPLHPRSPIGHFFLSQHVHVSLIMLYCMLIWFIMGAIFRWSGSFFQRDWSILRSIASHFGVMILTFALLANLAGFFPREKILSLTLTAVGEFTLIYLIISGAIYYRTYRNIQKINSGLSRKSLEIKRADLLISQVCSWFLQLLLELGYHRHDFQGSHIVDVQVS